MSCSIIEARLRCAEPMFQRNICVKRNIQNFVKVEVLSKCSNLVREIDCLLSRMNVKHGIL